jgi:hypothetical protein
MEERGAQFLLQLLYLVGERWLGDVQPGRGPVEPSLVDHRQKTTELMQLHDALRQSFLFRPPKKGSTYYRFYGRLSSRINKDY